LALAISGQPVLADEPILLARLEPEDAAPRKINSEKLLTPEGAREPVLLAAHHAYTLWSQQFMGTLLKEEQTEAWKGFYGMDIRMGDAYRQIGASAYQEARFEDAVKLLSVAVDFLDADAVLLGELGYSLKSVGQYERAIEVLQRAAQIDGANAEYWLWLGDSQRLMGQYEEAYRSLLTARDLAPEAGAAAIEDFLTYTEKLNDLTPSWENFDLHRDFSNRHEEASRPYRLVAEMLAALRVAPTPSAEEKEQLYKVAFTYAQIGTQFSFVKDPAMAVDFYTQAIEPYTQSDSKADLMRVFQNLAIAYDLMADRHPQSRDKFLATAVKYWDQSLQAARAAGDPSYVRHTQGGLLATLAVNHPMDDPKIVELREALAKEIPRKGPINEFTTASAVRGEVECRLRDGDLGGARVLIELADSYYKETGFLVDLEYRASALVQLAGIYLAQGHNKQASDTASQAADQITELRKFLSADAFQRSMNPQTLRRANAVRAMAALRDGSPEQALEALEQYQCVSAEDLLGSRVRDESAKTDFATEELLLLERQGWLKAELEKATAARETDRVDWLEDRLDQVAARVRRLPAAAALPSAEKLSYRRTYALSALEAQEQLPADTTVLHLIVGEVGGAAVLLTKTQVQGVELPAATEATVEAAMTALRSAAPGDAAATLRAALLDPLKDLLPKSGTLVFAGDQVSALLPLRLLDPAGEALAGAINVCHAPGASAFIMMVGSKGGKNATGLDAATGNVREALSTATPAGGALVKATVDLDSQDPTLALWQEQGATDPTKAMLTGELVQLALPHNVLALSLDITSGAEQSPQLHFAALGELGWRAGSGAIVLNQWPVAESARDSFFKALGEQLASNPPADAFRLAQDAARAAAPDSMDWAAFTYLGAP
jgi:tetratricopeptide (TPR) repeat protein